MRLRPSMRKFEVHGVEEADIEIARAFSRPNRSHLKKYVLIMREYAMN